MIPRRFHAVVLAAALLPGVAVSQEKPSIVEVEGQPLSSNISRLLQTLEMVGAKLPPADTAALEKAATAQDAKRLQEVLDQHVLVVLNINPEARVKAARGPAKAELQQGGYVPFVVKIINESTSRGRLRITSPQAAPVQNAGTDRQLLKGRFLACEMFHGPPMFALLSGLGVEYAVALIYSSEAGKREAVLGFDIGQGTQDLGFRAEVPVLFEVKPGIPVKLGIRDFDGTPTVGRFTFLDATGRVCPPQAKRLAPDFFFQQQVYRPDGGTVLLPPGELTVTYGRGPEYRLLSRKVTIPATGDARVEVKLERWINPMRYGFYSGDHHIHAAGCAHYTQPTEGVFADDMFLHVKGEGLNVGCNLTWGPCFEFQRQFFEPTVNKLSEPFCVLKYDIEVSGFGSQAMGHVCLLNLRDQTYPGSEGTKTKGWPTWTTPLMRWAKAQGAVTGYAHSANGLQIDPASAAARLIAQLDSNKDGKLSREEAEQGLLPDPFEAIDRNSDGFLSEDELSAGLTRVASKLPNYAIPEMNGIGAQEICVTTAQGLCDFISAMDTARIPEWNCWYHLMNCGFPLKASGETDFPCITGSRVGQGRVYVHLGKVDKIDFTDWCEGLRKGRSYVSDGYAHALEFTVNGKAPGYGDVALEQPGNVKVQARVAFAAEMPLGTSNGAQTPEGKTRKVELVVNGYPVAEQDVPADDREHAVSFDVPVKQSSWVALRHFPQMHTNPVNVLVGGKPIRASRRSVQWCIDVIEQLWRVRARAISAAERPEAEKTFQKVLSQYREMLQETAPGT